MEQNKEQDQDTAKEQDPGAVDFDMSAGPRCGAKRQRGYMGFCGMPAGFGTEHTGEGRCYMHGGRPEVAMEAVPALTERVKKISPQDAEALMSLGTQGLVLARARLVERLLTPGITTKEISDLTQSINRLDTLLARHPDINDPDASPKGEAGKELDKELRRLVALDKSTK